MRDNTGRTTAKVDTTTSTQDDMTVFDELPKVVRQALYDAEIGPIGALEVWKAINLMGHPPGVVAANIRKQARAISRADWKAAFGTEYPA